LSGCEVKVREPIIGNDQEGAPRTVSVELVDCVLVAEKDVVVVCVDVA
jgi:hypothetical protein